MGKVRVPEIRFRAMKDYVRPTSQKGLRSFLGTAGYYRRFVPNFSWWAGPLFGALKKGSPVKIVWGESTSDAFVYLTNASSCEHTLTMPREYDQLLVQTDASMEGVGAVLSVIRDNEESPVAYYSKQLSPAEKNYTVTELECLAVVREIDHFAIHLLGRDFTLVTVLGKVQWMLVEVGNGTPALLIQSEISIWKRPLERRWPQSTGLEGDRLTRNDNGLRRG